MNESTYDNDVPETPASPPAARGRLLALDPGSRRVGVAVSDELQLTVRPLPALPYSNWKRLLRDVTELLAGFDAQALVIGLPTRLDGTEGEAAANSHRLARNFALSLSVPVFLQDERLTSHAAEAALRAQGSTGKSLKARLDGEAAAIILRDYIAANETVLANDGVDGTST